MSTTINRRITLAARPRGAPKPDDFATVDDAVPAPGDGEMLLRTVYLSLDPYMRGRMNDTRSYVPPVRLGDTMEGGAVSVVEESRHPKFSDGDIVFGYTGWQRYAVSNGKGMRTVDPSIAPVSTALGILGMPGLTGYVGLLDLGQPKEGETVVVSAATGAVGSLVGQIAKLEGCRVVGVAGAEAKCRYAVDTLGLDACVSHRDADLAAALKEACPDGIDIYYENVGGKVFDAVIGRMNVHGRIPVCGGIAHYNDTGPPPGPDRLAGAMRIILTRRLTVRGFIIFDHHHRIPDFTRDVSGWLRDGRIVYREDVVDGIDNAVEAFLGLLRGENFGKLVVKVSDDPTGGG